MHIDATDERVRCNVLCCSTAFGGRQMSTVILFLIDVFPPQEENKSDSSRFAIPQVSILRGLKERYEVHHGVRLQDASLVAAAQLSHRYIADRFLPDKAIDLVDEAAAKLNIEASSKQLFPRLHGTF